MEVLFQNKAQILPDILADPDDKNILFICYGSLH